MKSLALITTIVTATSTMPARADVWTWVSISNGRTLDAHLARCELAQPNSLRVFAMIERLQSKPLS